MTILTLLPFSYGTPFVVDINISDFPSLVPLPPKLLLSFRVVGVCRMPWWVCVIVLLKVLFRICQLSTEKQVHFIQTRLALFWKAPMIAALEWKVSWILSGRRLASYIRSRYIGTCQKHKVRMKMGSTTRAITSIHIHISQHPQSIHHCLRPQPMKGTK